MITRAHITRRAAQDNVPAKTVERDYVLAQVIAGIGALENDTGLVFKGGTALRLCHFDDYRYSADLDFSLVSGSREDGYDAITRALASTGGSTQELHLTDDKPPRIAYVGPLGRERTLKLDLADDEMVLSTERQRLLPRWPDLPEDASVHVYTLLEIAGEKLRCVLQRLQCRDLYDLFILFEEAQVDATEAAQIFRPKAEHRDIDPDAFAARYRERIDQFRKRWEVELREHVPGKIPHFGDVERRVTRHLRRAGLL
jgi:predicted nucleotidyltransferase component of viral defense system